MKPAKPHSNAMNEETFVPITMRALYFCPASTAITDSTDLALPRVDSEVVFDPDFPTPRPSPGQYLIKVQTAAFSHDELRLAKALNPPKSIPQVPLHNFCGTVVSTPTQDRQRPNGSKFKIGDAVFGLISYTSDGAAADYVLAAEDEIALKPKNISAAEAATIPLPVLTAWQALFKYAFLDPTDTSGGGHRNGLRVLITNARDNEIGAQAVRLLRCPSLFPHYRPWICATSSSESQTVMLRKERQVDEIITRYPRLSEHYDLSTAFSRRGLEPVDIVLDCSGDSIFKEAHSPDVVKDQGTVLTAVDSAPAQNETPNEDAHARERGLFSRFIYVEPDGETLEQIATMVEQNTVRGRVESIVDLVDGARLLPPGALLAESRTKGGIAVLRVNA